MPTGPATPESVHVRPVPEARTENPASAPSEPDAWAATGHTPATNAKAISPMNRNLKSRCLTSLPSPQAVGPWALAHQSIWPTVPGTRQLRFTAVTKSAIVQAEFRCWAPVAVLGRGSASSFHCSRRVVHVPCPPLARGSSSG